MKVSHSQNFRKRILCQQKKKRLSVSDYYDSGIRCPACNSSNIEDYPDEDRMEGLAMYWFTGFPQSTMNLRYSYRCLDCGYEW